MTRPSVDLQVIADVLDYGWLEQSPPPTPAVAAQVHRIDPSLLPEALAWLARRLGVPLWENPGPHQLIGWAERLLAPELNAEDVQATAVALSAHRSGYVREVALQTLQHGIRPTLAVARLADDHVPQIRDQAQAWLVSCPLGDLAWLADAILEPRRRQRGPRWRALARTRLAVPAGAAELARVAQAARGPIALGAWRLAHAVGHPKPLVTHARDARVRQLDARHPANGAVRQAYLQDRQPQVRVAAIESLEPLQADRVPWLHALVCDRSRRVRRAVAWVARNHDMVWLQAASALEGPPVQRARAIETFAMARRAEAHPIALTHLTHPAPVLRLAAARALDELGELSSQDLVSLACDTTPRVARWALYRLRGSLRASDALRVMTQSAVPEVALRTVAHLPFWDVADLLLIALGERHPGFRIAEQRLSEQARRAYLHGWRAPGPERRQAIVEALEHYRNALPPAVVRVVDQVLAP